MHRVGFKNIPEDHCGVVEGEDMSITGITYSERFKSYPKNWPYVKTTDKCNPHSLALAGLMFLNGKPKPCVKCFACRKVISGLESQSDPWELHTAANPSCVIVQTGKPESPDGYTVEQVWHILEAAATAKQHEKYGLLDHELKTMLHNLNE